MGANCGRAESCAVEGQKCIDINRSKLDIEERQRFSRIGSLQLSVHWMTSDEVEVVL